MLSPGQGDGVIMQGDSLVIQGVGRAMAGDYSCTASNLEGDTVSDTLTLQIMCKL